MNQEFKKRVLSFIWRYGAFLVVSSLGFLLKQLGATELPQEAIILISYIIGEITKHINKKYHFNLKVVNYENKLT